MRSYRVLLITVMLTAAAACQLGCAPEKKVSEAPAAVTDSAPTDAAPSK